MDAHISARAWHAIACSVVLWLLLAISSQYVDCGYDD